MSSFDVIIIGAGAAGLMCAGQAGQRGRRVLVLDHAQKLAEKIRISGGGRCNFTNQRVSADNYISDNPHYCRSALAQYRPQDFIDLLAQYQVAWHERELGQLFCDDSSQQIIDVLVAECQKGQVTRKMGVRMTAIHRGTHFVVETEQGRFESESLVIATGGLSIPLIGATPFGYRIAEQFGLRVTELAPALVPLTFQPDDLSHFGELAGISLPVEASAARGPGFREAALFTHRGVSGPVILQVSSYWRAGETLVLDLWPEGDAHQLLNDPEHADRHLVNVLAQCWPKRFAQQWLERIAPNKPVRQYDKKTLTQIAERVHSFVLRPNGTQGYRKAEVTRGGVDTRDLSSKTMMAKNVDGLFFVGEVVDVTGWLGGYNFQWAWSSGYVAGQYC